VSPYSKLVATADLDAKSRDAFLALELWSSDNIGFPAEAYRRYIRDLYQGNQLARRMHRAAGALADPAAITCPVLVITASRDQICPPVAATALLDLVSSTDRTVLEVTGGHVGGVVGSRAARDMYPALIRWLSPRLQR
jgi:polyhydroxyalkanoate synthase